MDLRTLAASAATALALTLFVAPATHAQTARATATVCADGTTSTGSGTDVCAGHGGLKAKSTETVHNHVMCTDGTEHDTKAACAGHGGVKATTHVSKTTTVTKRHPDDADSVGALALCKNGMFSHATTRRGACAGHGGVARFLKP